MTERVRKTQTESMLLTCGQSFPECDTGGKEAREARSCRGEKALEATSSRGRDGFLHTHVHGIQSLLNSSGQVALPSFGEMQQKGSHMGSLVHRSQAVPFLFIQ